jgi:hypothetical protein
MSSPTVHELSTTKTGALLVVALLALGDGVELQLER